MSDEWLRILILISALGCGLVEASSTPFRLFIMKALDRLPPAQGITAMQSINIMVINPIFMAAFFGTALTCAIVIVSTLLAWPKQGGGLLLIGGLFYLFGTILVTGLFNVPRNNGLEAVDPASDEGARVWRSTSLNGRPGTMCAPPHPLLLRCYSSIELCY